MEDIEKELARAIEQADRQILASIFTQDMGYIGPAGTSGMRGSQGDIGPAGPVEVVDWSTQPSTANVSIARLSEAIHSSSNDLYVRNTDSSQFTAMWPASIDNDRELAELKNAVASLKKELEAMKNQLDHTTKQKENKEHRKITL